MKKLYKVFSLFECQPLLALRAARADDSPGWGGLDLAGSTNVSCSFTGSAILHGSSLQVFHRPPSDTGSLALIFRVSPYWSYWFEAYPWCVPRARR